MDRWKKIEDRKWELKNNNRVIATIFHKPTNKKYSLYISCPKVYKKMISEIFETHQFDTLEEAKKECDILLLEIVHPWAINVLDYIRRTVRKK